MSTTSAATAFPASEVPIWDGALPVGPSSPSGPSLAPAVSPVPAHAPTPAAAVNPPFPDREFFLPDGRPLLLTPGREAIMHQLFGGDAGWLHVPRDPEHAFALLFLCAHTAEPFPWNQRAPDPVTGLSTPLYLRWHDFNDAARAWVDAAFPSSRFGELAELAIRLWFHHQGADVLPDPAAEADAAGAEKKSADPAASAPPATSTSSSGSSPAATSPSGRKSSGRSRSATASPRATATSSRRASPASPPPRSAPAAPPRRKGSGKASKKR